MDQEQSRESRSRTTEGAPDRDFLGLLVSLNVVNGNFYPGLLIPGRVNLDQRKRDALDKIYDSTLRLEKEIKRFRNSILKSEIYVDQTAIHHIETLAKGLFDLMYQAFPILTEGDDKTAMWHPWILKWMIESINEWKQEYNNWIISYNNRNKYSQTKRSTILNPLVISSISTIVGSALKI